MVNTSFLLSDQVETTLFALKTWYHLLLVNLAKQNKKLTT